MSMRIAYDYQIFEMQQYGGVSRYYVELANRLARIPEVSVSVVSPLYINAYLTGALEPVRVVGRHVPELRHTGRLRRSLNRSLAPTLLAGLHPDLVHETFFSSERVAPEGSKTVVTVYDMIYELFPGNFASSDSLTARKRSAVERADHVICISEQTRQDLVSMFSVDPAKTSVVHLGLSLTKPPRADSKPPARPFLLFVGHRGGHKNFETLMRAYAADKPLQQTHDLVAFGGEDFTEHEVGLMRELGLDTRRIRQMSGDDSTLADTYSKAALLVYPSRYEGFGMPPLEAMSFDCPVVCSDAGSLPEVVGEAALTVDPDSAEQLASAVRSVLDDSQLRRDLVERGRERVKLFSWERCAQETLNIYQRLLS